MGGLHITKRKRGAELVSWKPHGEPPLPLCTPTPASRHTGREEGSVCPGTPTEERLGLQ